VQARQDDCTFLLPADAESPVLLADRLAPVDVLEVSHHGSGDAALGRLLARLQPRLAVISVGAHNRYGHPSAGTLTALAAARVPVRRTDLEGDIALTCPPG
jgi:competence protein ComEC